MSSLFYSKRMSRLQKRMSSSPVRSGLVRMRSPQGWWMAGEVTLVMSCVYIHWLVMLDAQPRRGCTQQLLVCFEHGVVVESCLSRGSVASLCNDTLYQKPTCWQARTLPEVIMSNSHKKMWHEQLCSAKHVEEICAMRPVPYDFD